MMENRVELAPQWIPIEAENIQALLHAPGTILKPGLPLAPEKFNKLQNQQQREYAKIRHGLTIQESKEQITAYLSVLSPGRAPLFFFLLSEGILHSIDSGIGHFVEKQETSESSCMEEAVFYRRLMCTEHKFVAYTFLGIGDFLARWKTATTLEHMLGRDLYLADWVMRPHPEQISHPKAAPSSSGIFVQPIIRQIQKP